MSLRERWLAAGWGLSRERGDLPSLHIAHITTSLQNLDGKYNLHSHSHHVNLMKRNILVMSLQPDTRERERERETHKMDFLVAEHGAEGWP